MLAILLAVPVVGCADPSAGVPEKKPCLTSYQCHLAGGCWEVDGQGCLALTDADCAQSHFCEDFGACQATADGQCDVLATSDCSKTKGCAVRGMCAAHDGVCRPTNDAMCRASAACTEWGACSFRETPDGYRLCRPMSEHDCQASQGCRAAGKCHLESGGCAPGNDHAVCQASDNCKLSGHCVANGIYCSVAPGFDCRKSQGCSDFGLCTLSELSLQCLGASDADCAASKACKDQGKCFYSDALRACAKQAPVWPPNW